MSLILPTVRILRLEENFKYGTFGALILAGEFFCVTLENPDIVNKKNISSIPAQQYLCRKVESPKWRETYEITDVPDRTHVLFHPGNLVEHTEGCIILGQHPGKLRENRAILNSGNTFRSFLKRMELYHEFLLTIKEHY